MRVRSMLVMVLAALGLAACAEVAPDINLVQPPYVEKDLFDGSWYYKSTVVDSAPTNQWVSQGDGDWAVIERLRWKVTEGFLYGYRDWEYVPGSETGEMEGADYYGSPIVMYAIKEHFDIRRVYNPQTGEETNVIDKNVELPWNERKFMVVDWATNMAPDYGMINWTFGIPISSITSNAYYVQSHEIDNADRARVGEDYIDVVGHYTLWPDFLGCWYEFYSAIDCAPGEIHIRHSFVKVDQDNDYETMPFPDSVDLVDDSGEYMRVNSSGSLVTTAACPDCPVKRIPIFERFGDYRLDRLTYDQRYDITESGVMRRANRFNIWKQSKDSDGNPIPYHQREVKPVIYYLNVEFPDDEDMNREMREKWSVKNASRLVGERWNQPFREVVAMLRVMSRTGNGTATKAEVEAELANVPTMFEVRDNDCNLQNVRDYVAGSAIKAELNAALDRYIGGIDNLEKSSLSSACTVIESLTETTDNPFTWQRHGDLRYNMLVWIDKPIEAGWIGLGPMFMDPITGETVSSTAHYAGAYADTAITRILDYFEAMWGELDEFDLITGQDISRYINEVKGDLGRQRDARLSDSVINEMNRRFRRLGNNEPEKLLREIPPGWASGRLGRIKGTPLEDLTIGRDDWLVAERIADPDGLQQLGSSNLMDLVSPARDFRREKPQRDFERKLDQMKRTRDMPEFFDAALLNQAAFLKGLSHDERYAAMRYMLFDAVMTHEVGHNVGMRHNFAGSNDALNFGKGYWDLQKLPADLDAARAELATINDPRVAQIDECLAQVDQHPGNTATTQHCLGAWEKMYSSIMDYHGKIVGDFNGLSDYDDAFIHFVYGGVLQAFDPGALDTAALGGQDLKQWLFYNDYKRIPEVFTNGIDGIQERHYVKYEWGASKTTMPEPENVVPYKMCSDEYANRLPECRTSDYGANQTEIIETELTRFKEYYYFSHFNRGRTSYYWYWDAMDANMYVMQDILQTFQYMYYYRANDPGFFDTDSGRDYLKASLMGINLFAEILAMPSNGRFLELDAQGGMLVSSMKDGYWRVEPTEDYIGGTTGGLPIEGGSGVLVAGSYFNDCDEAPGLNYSVPLGGGRPFFLNYSADYEEWVFTSLGSYFDKDNALFMLAEPTSTFLPFVGVVSNAAADPRTFQINFFRLFRDEVLNAFYGVISGDLNRYASVMRRVGSKWVFEPRQFINLDGTTPGYAVGADTKMLIPSMAYNLRYSALLYGMALMTNLLDGEEDFTHISKIAVKGQEDDIQAFDDIAEFDADGVKQKSEFVHPISGVTYRALRQGDTPIGFFMVEEANRRVDRWREFQSCVDDMALDTGLCECTYQSQVVDANGKYACPPRETGRCEDDDRYRRAEAAMEALERHVELMNNIRLFHYSFEYNQR